MTPRRPKETYPFTPDPKKNELLAASGTALLIGLCLDQQVRTEKAMSGPYDLRERIGHLDASRSPSCRRPSSRPPFDAVQRCTDILA